MSEKISKVRLFNTHPYQPNLEATATDSLCHILCPITLNIKSDVKITLTNGTDTIDDLEDFITTLQTDITTLQSSTNYITLNSTTTPYTKSLNFTSNNHYLVQNSNTDSINVLRKNHNLTQADPISVGKTSSNGQPWCLSFVCLPTADANNVICEQQNASASSYILKVMVASNNRLYFYYGLENSTDYIQFVSTNFVFTFQYQGVYIDYNGGNVDVESSNSLSDAYSRFRFYKIDINNSGTPTEITGTWSHLNNGIINTSIDGQFYIGGKTNNSFKGKLASFVLSTLRCNVDLPSLTEINMITIDPLKYITDYKLGNSYRKNSATGDTTNWSLNHFSSCAAFQVYLFGDTSGDTSSNRLLCYPYTSGSGFKMNYNNFSNSNIVNF